ncbi:MAG: glycoside hydrolase family 38 C-terminal domain-containing protein [Eubacteriales bacterium]|nr:glycoside hydrolase family 38 C-terminal domain-containing protein [Eubacteriales bacterium]
MMYAEWSDRLLHWVATLEKDFFQPVGELHFQGFTTYEHMSYEQASCQDFTTFPSDTPWGDEWEYLWLRAIVPLPENKAKQPLVLKLQPGGESCIYVNGNAFGTYRAGWVGIEHHYMVDNYLDEDIACNGRFELMLEVYAGHFYPNGQINFCAPGPVLPGSYENERKGTPRAVLGKSEIGYWNEIAYQLWLDVKTLEQTMQQMEAHSLRARKIEKALQEFTLRVDFEQPLEARVHDYALARECLKEALACKNGCTTPVFYGVGNAHLDVVWLWTLAETERKILRTFAAQLRLLERYPEYRFLQSQPQLYDMCKKRYPKLYQGIREAIGKGSWIAEGAMWVEPDTNMTAGESLVRQLLYGITFFEQELGVNCEILWLPDTFGYSAVLPQLLKDCGIKYLVTQKIFWSYNDGERFPYHYFTWQGMDGSRIDTFLPTSYTYRTDPKELCETWKKRVQEDDLSCFLLPFGYGDGGGGPTRDDIELALRQADLEGCPKIKMTHPVELFEDLQDMGGTQHCYVGELYFDAHRGVYTTQADIKKGNRRAELALRRAEIWSSLARAEQGYSYPHSKLETLWKNVLLNQFHDILPGSSIERVYAQANALYQQTLGEAEAVCQDALEALQGKEEGYFNDLSWERTILMKKDGEDALLTLPSLGYQSLCCAVLLNDDQKACIEKTDYGYVLQNNHVLAAINSNGEMTSFILKESGRQLAGGSMNCFRLYKDVPRNFDAWDIDSMYELQGVPLQELATVEIGANSPAKCSLRVTRKISHSILVQEIILYANSKRIEFDTTIQWHELHRLLKVSFPIKVLAQEGINEMQYGYVKRPTHRSRRYEKDRFEVCNHRYSALCEESHGGAVLNDCKYGVSMVDNCISLTLLRAAASPEMATDQGLHQFTYAFTGWDGSFLQSDVVRQGYELNCPPVKSLVPSLGQSYFSIKGAENIIIDCIKLAEDQSGDLMIRLYESKRASTLCELVTPLHVVQCYQSNLLEKVRQPLAMLPAGIPLSFRPFEVKTLRLVTCAR